MRLLSYTFLVLTLLLFTSYQVPVLAQETDKALAKKISKLSKKLKSSKWAEVEKAYEELLELGDPGIVAMKTEFVQVEAKLMTALQSSSKRYIKLLGWRSAEKKAQAATEVFANFKKNSANVVGLVLDQNRYPFPSGMVNPDTYFQKNQKLMEVYCMQSFLSYAAIEKKLGSYMKVSAKRTKSFGKEDLLKEVRPDGSVADDGTPMGVIVYDFPDNSAAWKKALFLSKSEKKKYKVASVKLRRLHVWFDELELPKQALAVDQLASALMEISIENYEEAAKIGKTLTALDLDLYHFAVNNYIISISQQLGKEFKIPQQSLDAFHYNNLYRLHIGVMPLLHNLKLYKAAKEHAEWCQANVMSHEQPDPSMRDATARASKQGYPTGVIECIASINASAAVPSWRTDAGHHQGIIDPSMRAAGLSSAGSRMTVWNTGASTEHPVEAIMGSNPRGYK